MRTTLVETLGQPRDCYLAEMSQECCNSQMWYNNVLSSVHGLLQRKKSVSRAVRAVKKSLKMETCTNGGSWMLTNVSVPRLLVLASILSRLQFTNT
jgi:hypothetical protein